MPLYVFECPEHGRFERLVPMGTTQANCCVQHGARPRAYGYSVALGSPAVDTRGMFRRFREASAELADKGVSTAGLFQEARSTANAMIRAGENPVTRSF